MEKEKDDRKNNSSSWFYKTSTDCYGLMRGYRADDSYTQVIEAAARREVGRFSSIMNNTAYNEVYLVFVWQKPVTSTNPDEGFCIPYWKYMDDEDVLNRIVIKPQNRTPFKYGSREVYNDDAIEVVNQLISVVDVLIEIGDDTQDWAKRKEWLNRVLNELWTARGPYPGFASVMESLGLYSFVSSYIGLTSDKEMKKFRQEVRGFLDGDRDEVNGLPMAKADAKRIRREYQLLDDGIADFLFDTLARFDIRADSDMTLMMLFRFIK